MFIENISFAFFWLRAGVCWLRGHTWESFGPEDEADSWFCSKCGYFHYD